MLSLWNGSKNSPRFVTTPDRLFNNCTHTSPDTFFQSGEGTLLLCFRVKILVEPADDCGKHFSIAV